MSPRRAIPTRRTRVGRVSPIRVRRLNPPPVPSRRGHGASISQAAGALLALFLVVGGASALATEENGGHHANTPTTVPAVPTATRYTPAFAAATVHEGRDYSYMAKAGATPAKWRCDKPIAVTLAGHAPDGAAAAVRIVTKRLAAASGLPLAFDTKVVTKADSATEVDVGELRISYDLTGDDLHAFSGPDKLGFGGPSVVGRWISRGFVVINGALENSDPTTPVGQRAIMHEMGHVLGLGHSNQSTSNLMAPQIDLDAGLQLGNGDRHALTAVGC